jgi:DNA-binding XRE family transcriptional regulator
MNKAVGPLGSTVTEHIQHELDSDPAFRKEWERLQANEEVAWSVIRLRMKLGISQEELARRIGVSPPTISRLESGRHSPNFATLRKIADAVGHKVVVTFTETGPKTSRRERTAAASSH